MNDSGDYGRGSYNTPLAVRPPSTTRPMQVSILVRPHLSVRRALHGPPVSTVFAKHSRQISLLSRLSRWALRSQEKHRGSLASSPNSSALPAQSGTAALDHSRNALFYSAKANETFITGRFSRRSNPGQREILPRLAREGHSVRTQIPTEPVMQCPDICLDHQQ